MRILYYNSPATAGIKKFGNSHSVKCNASTKQVREWSQIKGTYHSATHIQGKIKYGTASEIT